MIEPSPVPCRRTPGSVLSAMGENVWWVKEYVAASSQKRDGGSEDRDEEDVDGLLDCLKTRVRHA